MRIKLAKGNGLTKCRNPDCKKNPDFISDRGRIKVGTTCVAITMDSAKGWSTSFYCRECIDQVYLDLKAALNPKLWAFH